jgi:hydroxymethylpyrimidine/phosphomethylpyrimidine kinase
MTYAMPSSAVPHDGRCRAEAMTAHVMKGRVLIVAGSDSGGGAGIQADIKTVTALGGFAMTAITALTAQNTRGVTAIHEVPPEFVTEQMRQTLTDIGADAIKTGMLHRADIIEAVCKVIDDVAANVPLVVDPVMVAKGGAELLAPAARDALIDLLIPRADVLTPNLPEAAVLTGRTVETVDDMLAAGEVLLKLGPRAVLMKGGHLPGNNLTDILMTPTGRVIMEGERIETRNTHGTGCTTASAIAAGLAQGLGVEAAVRRARAYVLTAIRTAPRYGGGHGPLNHAHTMGIYRQSIT